jgi:hypothetical protein
MSDFSTALSKVNDAYFPMIEKQLSGKGIVMGQYARQCVMTAISAINAVLDSNQLTWNDKQLDQSSVTDILLKIASLQLNASASPREVYFIVRSLNTKVKDAELKDIWKKQIELGIEGDGNDSLLRRFGADIDKVGQYWLVREGDTFEYPVFTGFDVIPPKWSPKGTGDIVRVVYPIKKKDGTVEFHIAERADVSKNLIAHMNNNMMNATFGIFSGKKYDASADQKKQIEAKKAELLKKANEAGLAALDDPELQPWISPAWTEYQSREAMIIRKMRNNIVKKIPKDFGNAFVEMIYSDTVDESVIELKREIEENANTEPIDIEGAATVEPIAPPITVAPPISNTPTTQHIPPVVAGSAGGPDF